MSRYDELIERLTHRLRIDPELHMDVANELRTHLEDATEQFRAAGYSEEEAHANAVKALGDEEELAELLWQANRRRIRTRQVIKWAARATRVPAAIIVVLMLPVSGQLATVRVGSLLSAVGLQPVQFGPQGSLMKRLAERSAKASLSDLSPQQRFILRGDEDAQNRLERERSIVDRYPENLVYYGNYVNVYLNTPRIENGLEEKDPNVIKEVIVELDRGQRIDPDNAFYNFMKAKVLLNASSKLDLGERACNSDKRRCGTDVKHYRIEVTDQTMFNRGLAEFNQGLLKPELTNHVLDMASLRLKALPPSTRLHEYLLRTVAIAAGIVADLLPRQADMRRLARLVLAYARQQRQSGSPQDAVELARGVQILGAKHGARARTVIEMLVAQAIVQKALECEIDIFEELNLPDQAREARAKLDEQQRLFEAICSRYGSRGPRVRPDNSMYMAAVPTVPGYSPDPEPMRKAEYAVAEQVGLTVLLAVLALLMLLAGVVSLITMARVRSRQDGPKLLFIGWRRLGRICTLSILLPLGLYALYAHASPFNGRQYGLHMTFERVIVEFVLVIGVIVVLFMGFSFAAIRERAEKAGLTVPAGLRVKDRRRLVTVGGFLGLLAIAYVVLRELGFFEPVLRSKSFWDVQGQGLAIAGAIGVFLLVWAIIELVRLKHLRGELLHYRRTLFRSFVPTCASAVIVVGLLCGIALIRGEAGAVEHIRGSAEFGVMNEVEQSDYRRLRNHFAAEHEAMLKELRMPLTTRPVNE